MTNKLTVLDIIKTEASTCSKCDLHKGRTKSVFYRGSPDAKVMIVGEAPGQDEDEQGQPFVGRSGQLLNQALIDLGLDPDTDIYVCNIIKCRPPNNRKPTDEESTTCFPYLEDQIKEVKPNIIVALGATAMDNLINTAFGITKMHGKFVKSTLGTVMPTFHPSYILRSGGTKSPLYIEFKADLLSAFDKVKQLQKEEEKYFELEEATYYDLNCAEE